MSETLAVTLFSVMVSVTRMAWACMPATTVGSCSNVAKSSALSTSRISAVRALTSCSSVDWPASFTNT